MTPHPSRDRRRSPETTRALQAAGLIGAGAGAIAGAAVAVIAVVTAGVVLAASGHLAALRPSVGNHQSSAATAPTRLDTLSQCVLSHQGRPDVPDTLVVDCPATATDRPTASAVEITLPGPFGGDVGLDTDVRDQNGELWPDWLGWNVTNALVVGGEARVWFTQNGVRCLVKRDLLDTRKETAVVCQLPQEQKPSPAPTTSVPATPPSLLV